MGRVGFSTRTLFYVRVSEDGFGSRTPPVGSGPGCQVVGVGVRLWTPSPVSGSDGKGVFHGTSLVLSQNGSPDEDPYLTCLNPRHRRRCTLTPS